MFQPESIRTWRPYSGSANRLTPKSADPIAWNTSTDPEQGLLLNFFTNADGSPLFVQPAGIDMGADDIPNSGIYLNGQIYFIANTGSQSALGEGPSQANDFSILIQFNETAQTFTGGRTISPTGGHFIGTSMYAYGSSVFIFGAGPYRASNIYMQMVPASTFSSGGSTAPAKPGETAVLYANGFGPTSVPVASGAEMQSGTLSTLPVITIGGVTAAVSFAGLVAPGQFQFNVVMPASLANGDQPITATYSGLATQAGTLITVQQ